MEKTIKRNLIQVEGTVSNVIATNMEFVNSLCISSKPLEEVKTELVELLETNAKKCKSRDKIIANIKKQLNKYKVFQYVCDTMLAGAGEAVINVAAI